MESRLSIKISDTDVVFKGKMSLKEAYFYMEYFEREGYDHLMWGESDSCLHLVKLNEDGVRYGWNNTYVGPPSEKTEPHINEFFQLDKEKHDLKTKIAKLQIIIKKMCQKYDLEPELDKFGYITSVNYVFTDEKGNKVIINTFS